MFDAGIANSIEILHRDNDNDNENNERMSNDLLVDLDMDINEQFDMFYDTTNYDSISMLHTNNRTINLNSDSEDLFDPRLSFFCFFFLCFVFVFNFFLATFFLIV